MITVGVDLATQPAKTGLAVVEWRPGGARLTRLRLGVDDHDVVEVALTAQKVGIDCPLGWPDAFITAHAGVPVGLTAGESGDDLRRRLAHRETDRVVRRAGYPPLVVAEVYPAASLGRWGLPHRQDEREGDRAARTALVAAVREQVPWLDLGGHVALCEDSHDALDALVAALTARAAATGRCAPPPEQDGGRARREGWILLPEGPLSTLVDDGPAAGGGRRENMVTTGPAVATVRGRDLHDPPHHTG